MSFDALTITGLIAAVLCAGFLIALINRDDADAARPPHLRGVDPADGSDRRS